MRARSPHPSGPYGDHLQYSTGTGQTTPEPQLHTQQTKPSVAGKIKSVLIPLMTSHFSMLFRSANHAKR